MCTETKDARVHCTILNDHTNRHHTPHNREAGERSPLETNNKPHTPKSAGPVVLSGPNSVLPDHPHNRGGREFGDSTFLEQPPPTPETSSGRYWGPPPPERHAQNIRL
jgi:hypothetical protein